MIQVYKKNELFIIENTVTDIIYPNLTREEALVLLKKFDRDEPEDRCDFAIKEDNISFEYASIDDKDKTIADLEAKLAEKDAERELDNAFWKQECDSLQKTLAEKEKEILDIKFMMRNTEQALRNVPNAMAGQRKRIDELTKELKQDNQDKISFAIAELEKVKDWCENHKFSDEDDYVIAYEPDEEDASGCVDYLKDQIDNQIKQLREGGRC